MNRAIVSVVMLIEHFVSDVPVLALLWCFLKVARQGNLSNDDGDRKETRYLGLVLLGMCRWPLRAPAPL